MDSFEHALPSGTLIDDRYRIDSVLGEGGFAITYKAFDTKLQCDVAIKEFLPNDLAARSTDTKTVQPRTNRNDDYSFGLNKFLDEARTLAKLQHPHIVQVTNFIEAHGTGYLVMTYSEGQELGDWLKTQPGQLSEEAVLGIITPILEGLTDVHQQGLLHRDIKPANIFLRQKGGPMLIDFGAARQAVGEKSKSISAIISQGYAPPEQYTSRGKQGAFTDLYAIGATLYRLITEQTPVDASDRSHAIPEGEEDPLVPATIAGKGKVSPWLLALTDQLLNIVSKQRPQSAEAVLDAIKNTTTVVIDAAARPSTQTGNNKTRVINEGERFSSSSREQSSSVTKIKTVYIYIVAAVYLVRNKISLYSSTIIRLLASKSKTSLYSSIAVAVFVIIGVYVSQQSDDGQSKSEQMNPDASLKEKLINEENTRSPKNAWSITKPAKVPKARPQDYPDVHPVFYQHPAFADAPVPAVKSYTNISENKDSTINLNKKDGKKTTSESSSKITTKTTIADFDRITRHSYIEGNSSHRNSYSKKQQSSSYKLENYMVLGGLVGADGGLSGHEQKTIDVTNIQGKLFPLKVGNRMSFTTKRISKGKNDCPFVFNYVFAVTERINGATVDSRLKGELYKIEQKQEFSISSTYDSNKGKCVEVDAPIFHSSKMKIMYSPILGMAVGMTSSSTQTMDFKGIIASKSTTVGTGVEKVTDMKL